MVARSRQCIPLLVSIAALESRAQCYMSNGGSLSKAKAAQYVGISYDHVSHAMLFSLTNCMPSGGGCVFGKHAGLGRTGSCRTCSPSTRMALPSTTITTTAGKCMRSCLATPPCMPTRIMLAPTTRKGRTLCRWVLVRIILPALYHRCLK